MNAVDSLWLFSATVLVFGMQAGFLLLEAGKVRSKNSINVAQKNSVDFFLTGIAFTTIGIMVMYGVSSPVFQEVTDPPFTLEITHLEFLYQLGFCGAAVTIVSGAVSERIKIEAYFLLVIVLSALAFPIAGRLVWGTAYGDDSGAWLANIGFVDFAGGTVVHLFGGVVGLVAAYLLGPRAGCSREDGVIVHPPSSNSIFVLLGSLILLFGWLGFNAGSVSTQNEEFSSVILHTLMSGLAGGLGGMLAGYLINKKIFKPADGVNGMLGGLVCSTAGIHLMNGHDSIVMGFISGVAVLYGAELVKSKLKIDDPLDAFAVHAIAGATGVIGLVFYADSSASLPVGSVVGQLGVQLLGACTIIVIAIVFSYVPLRILASKGLLRVSTEAELVGLNFSEHGESLQIDEIERLIVDAIGAQPDAANTDSTGSTILHEKSLLGDTISKLVLDKKNIEESLQQQKQRLHNLAKAKADVVWETDSELMVNTCETSEAELQVFLNQSFINRHLFDSLALDSKNYPSVLGRLENLQPTGKFTSEIKSRERSVDSRHFEIVCTPTFDSAGNFSGFTGSLNDITSKVVKEKNDYLKTLMDASSGLGNSKAMGIALKTRLNRARNSKRSICIACMELAECTSGNGVQESNALPRVIVREIVAIANNSLGAEDRIFHTDASQLLIILDDLPFKRAQEMAQTVCNRIATEINKNFCKVNVNADTRFVCKMGFAIYPQDGQSASTLQDRAESALKAAIGNDNCHVLPFETDAESKMRVREARKQELEQAIDNDEFFLVYQPQIETSSQTVTGFEALVRWQHPERGIVPPFEFIEDVESLGLMCRLGMVVLEKAAIFAKDLNQRYNGSQLSVAVNVSPTQIQTDGFVDKALDIIKKYELTSHCLHLEITEEAYISDFKGLRVKLETLIDHGFQLALDDFGTGNTSLVYLQELPANKLKIDKSFVDSIIDSEQASSVARGILELGRKMDMTVTAEGVENVDQFELLREWGCDEIQGFYFAKPMSYQEAMIYPESAIGGAEAA